MNHSSSRRSVALWLLACCGMVFVMALVGAVTRLTQSGLSITDWQPLMGAVPPLNAAEWDKAFSAYQQIPQYKILNRGMSLEAFKGIYFWEWFHRLWGRLIGVVFALPFLWFLLRGKIDRWLGLRLAGFFALGGLQGFIGWFMVQSGLAVRTSVSPYRLALHLFFALLIYALMLWTALALLRGERPKAKVARSVMVNGWLVCGLLVVTMIWGAFTAGLHAGEAYNTWPLMEGDVLPDAAFTLLPRWLNIFENLALVQFVHRWLGPLTMLALVGFVLRTFGGASTARRRWLAALGGMAVVQVSLGIATLLSHANIVIATLHQAGAITLLTLLLINLSTIDREA